MEHKVEVEHTRFAVDVGAAVCAGIGLGVGATVGADACAENGVGAAVEAIVLRILLSQKTGHRGR